jgi:hypothetical protein
MAFLCLARLLVALAPFGFWRKSLALRAGAADSPERTREARRLAAHVERGAARLPLAVRCLPRAMALSWMLRRRGVRHMVVFAVRPAPLREGDDALHAWVEQGGGTILGEVAGPWHETLRLGN